MTFEEIIRLAEEGNTDAMVSAIQEFVWSDHIEIGDCELVRGKTLEYLNKAILGGNTSALNQLGAMYAEGRLVEKDPGQAFSCYKLAAEMGDPLATSNLGFCYLSGNGTEKNYEEAYKAFSKAALLDIGDAVVRLGDMFRYGHYVSQDPRAAFSLYTKAKVMALRDLDDFGNVQVYSDAMLRLADCSYYGIGTEKDLINAVRCYAEALFFYDLREKKGDDYSGNGYQRAKEMLAEALSAYGGN